MTQVDTALWERISRNLRPENDCLVWTKYRDECGYGRIRVCNKTHGVHRLSWMIENGPIPDGLHVLHKCDTPACANPDHLFLGTHDDNMADKVAKGRQAKSLSPEQVSAIGLSNESTPLLSDRFGVSPGHIRKIRARARRKTRSGRAARVYVAC